MTDKELRELDAWIAEHVMGFTWHKLNRRDTVNVLLPPRRPDERSRFDSDPANSNDAGGAPYYTADPAAAMEVLKVCADKHNTPVHVWHRSDEHYAGQWHIANSPWGVFALAETLELAICLFAKALFTK